MWGGNMMGWGGGGFFGIGHILLWVVVIVVVVLIARWLMGGTRSWGRPDEDRAQSILKERYARGEIDKAEFDARRRDIV